MKYLYRAFQLLVSLPVAFISTVATAVTVIIGCTIGNGHFWGYYPGKWWSKLMVRIFLLPVTVEGRENLEPEQSYVFVANHQGAFDIFLIYGYLGRNFKWMMKRELERIPFVGYACRKARFIFVDKRNPGKVRETYGMARNTEQRYEPGCLSRGCPHVYRTDVRLQERCFHAIRRTATAHRTAYDKRFIRCATPHERLALGFMASAPPHNPSTYISGGQGTGECFSHASTEL